MSERDLLTAATNAAMTLGAIYEWLDRVEKLGGATSIEGVSACHAMLTSLRKNAGRCEKIIMAPLRAAIAEAERNKSEAGTSAGEHFAEISPGKPHKSPG